MQIFTTLASSSNLVDMIEWKRESAADARISAISAVIGWMADYLPPVRAA